MKIQTNQLILIVVLIFGCNQKGSNENSFAFDSVKKQTDSGLLNQKDHVLLLGDSIIHQEVKVTQLAEKTIINDSTSEYKDMCENWMLNQNQVIEIIRLSKIISGSEMHDLYYDLPCRITGKIEIKGKEYDIIVNGGSFLYIYNETESIYLGCSSDNCQKYFVEQGGDRVRDIPDY